MPSVGRRAAEGNLRPSLDWIQIAAKAALNGALEGPKPQEAVDELSARLDRIQKLTLDLMG